MIFGELDRQPSDRARAFLSACQQAGFDVDLSDDIETAIWEKFVFLAPIAGVTSVTRSSIGAVMADPDVQALFRDAVAETVAVGRASGIRLADDAVDRVLKVASGLPGEMRTSMEQDLERGSRLEVQWLNGAVVQLGRQAGVATPINRTLHAALKSFARGRSGR